MKKLVVIWLSLLLCACDSGLSAGELPYFEYTETEPAYEYVWLDDEIPEDFDPETDYLYLNFALGKDTRVLRINPYTLRTTELCADPLCDHGNRLGCPCFGLSPRMIVREDILYSTGQQYAKVMGYNGETWAEMDGSRMGLTAYHLKTGEMRTLVHHDTMCQPVLAIDIDFAYADGYLYYYAEEMTYDDEGKEIREEDGDPVTETHLYRVKMKGNSAAEDLGLYQGYTNLIIEDGCIWNYYGFFNESGIWQDIPQDSWVLTDLDNENPAVIPEVKTPLVNDPDGYCLADCRDADGTGSVFLLYTGEEAERHVYRSDEEILYYGDGWIWTAEELQEQWTEGGVIRSRPTGLAMRKTDIFTGKSEEITMPDCPGDAGYLSAAAVVDGRYVILAVHGAISIAGAAGYYLRYDTATGATLPIYP